MLPNKILLLFLLFTSVAFSQEKKVDTVYVYEEVIVHDTIYIEKSLNELKLENVIFTKGENNEKDKLEITKNGKKIQIQVDSTNIILPKIKPKEHIKSWFFGGKLLLGIANNSLFKELNAPTNIGSGLGIWIKKQLFNPNFFVGFGFDGLYFTSPFSFDASQNDSALNGYYFTENNQPKLFQSVENKHFQMQIPIQFYYKIKKFTPSIGLFASVSNYKAAFKGSSGSLPLSLDETQIYKAQAIQVGYLVELHHELTKHISVGINFSSGKSNNLVFVNKYDNTQSFKTQNSFTENRLLLQLRYKL
ncbi:hypothetical protein [Flavobacterium sp.]|jgi:hypothetical protein|uniref:hypothetical protein n=1 Tax=Flavobacterium sp. TaxID=239 RepID=UPI0037C1AF19